MQNHHFTSTPSISAYLAQHWHCFALSPQILICYTWYSQKFCRRPFPEKRSGRFAVKVVVIILIKKIRRILQDERAEANYFSTMVFIFIAVLLLAFIIDLFSIISTKQELDLCADQMVKQIQLAGGVNAETDQLFNFLCSQIEGAHNISYSIDASYKSPTPSGMNRAIQLGSPFYITIKGEAKLGGFWNFDLVHINIVSRAAGVSEHYWK